MTTNAPSSRRLDGRRLAITGGIWLLLLYGLFVSTGYAWLHYALKNDRIGFADVALFRWHRVRQAMAVDQFAAGKAAGEAGDFQAAYLAYTSGVRNDPDNVEGRLLTARFLGAAGAVNLELGMLEDGLGRAPDDRRLIDQTFTLLTASGRDRHALDMLHKRYASKLSGPNGPLLRTFEVLATLDKDGPEAASALLERYPDLKQSGESSPVVARVLWETKERLSAIDLLATYVQSHPDSFASTVQLAGWQEAAGLAEDGLETAKRVCVRFPKDFGPRILLIEMTASARTYGSLQWQQAVESYLKDFGGRPEAVVRLAKLAGQNGWIELARVLYEVGANRQQNLSVLALAYSDALASGRRYSEAGHVLVEVEIQAEDGNPAFLRLLRQSQVEVAAARGDHEGTREYARRLAAALGGDPDAVEMVRRRFAELGITEAVAELTNAAPKAPATK
jgi:tetratricopeptide (TPR) repeat protein